VAYLRFFSPIRVKSINARTDWLISVLIGQGLKTRKSSATSTSVSIPLLQGADGAQHASGNLIIAVLAAARDDFGNRVIRRRSRR